MDIYEIASHTKKSVGTRPYLEFFSTIYDSHARKDTDEFGTETIENYSGKIKFKNVVFEYDEGQRVLNKASFEILPKQTVAFVGESCSGKSSIINLIAHLYIL